MVQHVWKAEPKIHENKDFPNEPSLMLKEIVSPCTILMEGVSLHTTTAEALIISLNKESVRAN